MTTAISDSGPPVLLLHHAFVGYADILGFSSKSERAFAKGKETDFLNRIKSALTLAYEDVRQTKDLLVVAGETCGMKVFTDNIVVEYAVQHFEKTFGERELLTLLNLFARVQAVLTSQEFLLRGAISFGKHYQDDDIAFGPALLEATGLDKSGRPPALIIAPSVEQWVVQQISSYERVQDAPQYKALLEDPANRRWFVNYLDLAIKDYDDPRVTDSLLASHRKMVVKGLRKHKCNEAVHRKYRWLASYHNYVCQTFANRFSTPVHEDADPEYADYCAFAQDMLNHRVPMEDVYLPLQPPRPINVWPTIRSSLSRLSSEDIADYSDYQGQCLRCRQVITAKGGVQWRTAVRRPCPHCGWQKW